MITTTEAWLTFIFFFVLILLAWLADKYKSMSDEKDKLIDNKPVIEYQAVEIFRELINEKNGVAAQTEEEVEKRQKMKKFIKETMNTDQIEKVDHEELKKIINGDEMLTRIKYRKQVALAGKRDVVVAKGEVFK